MPKEFFIADFRGNVSKDRFLVSFSKLFPRGLPEDVFLPASAGTSEVVSVEP